MAAGIKLFAYGLERLRSMILERLQETLVRKLDTFDERILRILRLPEGNSEIVRRDKHILDRLGRGELH